MVGFFGFGSPGFGASLNFGYGNVGWVPLAPYERYRPWYGRGYSGGRYGTVIANEEREVTAYAVRNVTMIDFTSEVKTELPRVKLDGDPQHAGFHFRAAMEVAKKTNKETYYLRPDGKGKPGETRNWDAKTRDPKTVNRPWDAMSFVLGGQRYTAAYLDRPDNPKEARYSEREYGRFGSYFEYTIDEGKPLTVNYRVWLQEGLMKPEDVAALSQNFVEPVQVTVRAR